MLYEDYVAIVGYALSLFLIVFVCVLYNKNKKLKNKYQKIDDVEKTAQGILDSANSTREKILSSADKDKNKIISEKENIVCELEKIKEDYKDKKQIYDNLLNTISIFEDKIEYIELGLDDAQFEFDDPDKIAIDEIREKQREMAINREANNAAIYCSTDWTVSGSIRAGRRLTNESIKITLRAFNNECDTIIRNVSWKNYAKSIEKINKAFDFFNDYNKTKTIKISSPYLGLKLKELKLAYENQERKKQIKEEQRAIREQIREEERFERDRIAAEKEEEKYKKLLKKAQEEIEKASGEKLSKLNEEIENLTVLLKEAEEKNQRAISMAQQTKAGHVYIISNIGSFGDNVFKIGMTRRLDPYERVYELSGASVPFEFDVHAMIPCKDAPALETKLHKAFEKYKMNLVNNRREFFKVSLDEIEKEVKQDTPNAEFIRTALAEQYKKSEVLRKQRYETINEPLKEEFPNNI